MSGRCTLTERSEVKFGVMMGFCVCAYECGRYPSDQPGHEGNPLAVMWRPRLDRWCQRRSGVELWWRFRDTSKPRGASDDKAARPTKSRQGYKSYFVFHRPDLAESEALVLIGLRELAALAPKRKFPGAHRASAASKWRRDVLRHDPCVVRRRATISQRSRLISVVPDVAFPPQDSAIGREASAQEPRALPVGRARVPGKHEGIRVCKRKGSVQFPAYF